MIPILLLAAYAVGVAAVRFVPQGPPAVHGLMVVALFLAWLILHRSHWSWLPFLGLLGASGFLSASLDLRPPVSVDHISHLAGRTALNLEGRILAIEDNPVAGYRLLLNMQHVTTAQGSAKVWGRVQLFIREGRLQARPGQLVRWRSPLRKPLKYGNPGEFDYPLHLAARGIYATAFVAKADQVVVLVNRSPGISTLLARWRYALAARIKQVAPAPTAGLLQALLVGMRSGISQDQRRLLANSGVAHLFAVSGLHFGLLALLLYRIGRWFYSRSQYLLLWCPPQKFLPVLLTIPLAGYVALTGHAWATWRAFLMVSVVALLYSRGRRTPPLTLLATVAFGLLLVEPLALFQPGFQLSFCGIAGILAWLQVWQPLLTRLPTPLRWLFSLLFTTATACLATAPASLWHFHQIAPAGLVTNLVAIPLIGWGAVPAGLLSLALMPWAPVLADNGLIFSAWLVSLALHMVDRISRWPGLAAIPHYLTVAELIVLIGALLLFLPLRRSFPRWRIRLGLMLVTLAAAWALQPQATDFQVVALSVGQGDATLITLPGRRHYLIDGGGLPGSSIDPGERLVAPALGRMGINRLQGVILSHNHPDHSLGLVYILERFPVAAFYLAGETTALPPSLQKALQENAIPIHHLPEGWTTLPESGGQVLKLFVPDQSAADLNERSVVVFTGPRTQGVLLPADLGESGVQQLLTAGLPGRVTLLKMPHHGSRHASPELFLDRLTPSLAFVSSGFRNPYGFPHQQTVTACNARHVELFRTDQAGMLTFHLGHRRWQVESGKAL